MNNQLRVFHHNTLIVYNSTSHLAQNRMESRSSHEGVTLKGNCTTTGQALVGKDLLRVARRHIVHW
jgi:hypothetical protein